MGGRCRDCSKSEMSHLFFLFNKNHKSPDSGVSDILVMVEAYEQAKAYGKERDECGKQKQVATHAHTHTTSPTPTPAGLQGDAYTP